MILLWWFSFLFEAWKLNFSFIAIRKKSVSRFSPFTRVWKDTRVNKWWHNIHFWVNCSVQQTEFSSSLCRNTEQKVMEVERINTKHHRTMLVSSLLAILLQKCKCERGKSFLRKDGEDLRRQLDIIFLSISLARFLLRGLFIPLKISVEGKMFALIYSSSLISWRQTPSPHVCHPLISSIPLVWRSERFINGL